MNQINSFEGKKVLVFGLGQNQGGVGSALFFASQNAHVRITDLKTKEILKSSINQLTTYPNISYTLGEHKTDDIDWADLIIKNPAVKPGNSYIEYALEKGKRVEQDMGIFLEFVKPSQIIGITGTKGKSTTASLIYEILKEGRDTNLRGGVVLAGNIGTSVLECLNRIDGDTLVILELSSFQLEAFDTHKVSPHWAIITNIYEDHLNYYKNMDEYISAKKIIAKYQNSHDFLFIKREDPVLNNPKFLTGLKGQTIFYSSTDLPVDFEPILKGEHNLSNISAAFALGNNFNINPKFLLKSLIHFKGVPFRMELIKEWAGFKIYNDTTATNPNATVEALKTLGSEIILICGGMNKNMNYRELSCAINRYAKAVYFLEGDVADEIICDMADQSIIEGRFNNLEELLKKLKEDIRKKPFYFKKGDIILFSPGATSFNMFQNEFDRGRKFNKAIDSIF